MVLEFCFCWMFWMLYTSLLWYLFDLHMLMMLDILNCFVMWFRCCGSWVWACPLELIQFYARNMFFVTLLWVKRSDTSCCFFFILNLVFIFVCCQFAIFIVLHIMGSQWWEYVHYIELYIELGFYFCLLRIYNFFSVAYYGKPVERICSLFLLHNVGILIIGFHASFFLQLN